MGLRRAWSSVTIADQMIISLLVVTAYNLYTFGLSNLLPVAVLPITAVALDLLITYAKERHIFRPKSALITGLILGLIVQGSPMLLAAIAAAAVLSKHIIKIKGRHVFNPANLALFLALFLPVSQSWWGLSNLLLVAVFGILIVAKLKMYHLVLPFLALHAVLMLVALADIGQLASHIASGSLLFFAFYMLIEPVTSPARMKGRIVFGLLAGAFAAVLYVIWLPAMLIGSLFFADLFVPLKFLYTIKYK